MENLELILIINIKNLDKINYSNNWLCINLS